MAMRHIVAKIIETDMIRAEAALGVSATGPEPDEGGDAGPAAIGEGLVVGVGDTGDAEGVGDTGVAVGVGDTGATGVAGGG